MARHSLKQLLVLSVAAGLTLARLATGQSTGPAPPPAGPVRALLNAVGPNNAPPPGQGASEVLRFSRNVPGDSKPITIAADEVTTWVEGGRQVVLARGAVLVQQSVVQLHAQQVVAWVDLDRLKRTGIMQASLYAEGQVRLDTSTKVQEGQQAAIDLNTRNGSLPLRSYRTKIAQQSLASEAVVGRARSVLGAPAAGPVAPVQPVSGTMGVQRTSSQRPALPAPPEPPSGLQRTSYEAPAAPLPVPPPPATPAAGSPPNLLPPLPVPPPPPSPGMSRRSDGEARNAATEVAASGSPAKPEPSGIQRTFYQAPFPAPPPTGTPAPAAPPAPVTAPLPAPPPTVPVSPPIPPQASTAAPSQPGLQVLPPPTPLPPPATPAAPPRNAAALDGGPRQWSVAPRNLGSFNIKIEPLGNNEQAIIVTGGVILTVREVKGIGILDLEADRLVIWTKSLNPQAVADGMRQPGGSAGRDLEFYLAGNVELRQQAGKDQRTIRADEVYYDVNRNVAIATKANLEIKDPKIAEPIVVRTPELLQVAANQYEVKDAEIAASKLSSDPEFKVYVREATIEEKKVPQLSIFGREVVDRRTGGPLIEPETRVVARNVFFELQDVPIFYLPYVAGDARDPLGPLESLSFGFNRVFGVQAGLTWDIYELLGIQKYEGTRWTLETDYLSYRGPALGINFDYAGKDFLGMPSQYQGLVRSYGIYDRNFDNLGGPAFRDQYFTPAAGRGRFTWRQGIYELPEGFTVQSQLSLFSDRNFFEQYFKYEFDREVNQNSYVYVKQQQDQFAWTGYVDKRFRSWMTETEALPRFDGWGVGLSIWDTLTYTAHASAGYFQLKPTTDVYPSTAALGAPRPTYPNPNDIRNFFPRTSATDVANDTARFDFFQELSLPFQVGAVKVTPYGKLSLTEYTNDLMGQEIGRVWGGGGVRASLPFSRLYQESQSELFNVNGLFHKVTLSGNYFIGGANEPFNRFAQLDRFNDDVSDQAIRDIRADYLALYGATQGNFLATSNLFDPQYYAIRRLIDNRIDTLDDIQVLQFDVLQRWQTKRGYPGAQHIIDWMVLDLSGSFFPAAERDNFGSSFAFLEYDYLWNMGDRTAFTSSGWYDPIDDAARYYDVAVHFNRPDRTFFRLGFRYTDPLESRVAQASVTYIFSPKYAMNAGFSYDFGTNQSQSTNLSFTRIGKDLQVTLGIQYNSLQDNLGLTFEIFPNLAADRMRRSGGMGLGGQNGMMGGRR